LPIAASRYKRVDGDRESVVTFAFSEFRFVDPGGGAGSRSVCHVDRETCKATNAAASNEVDMDGVKVLTVTPDDSADLVASIHDILASGQLGLSCVVHSCQFYSATAPVDVLLEPVSSFEPHVILFVARGGGSLSHAKRLLKDIICPILVISDGCGAEEIMDALSSGVSDFIAAPVRAYDLLPRIWKIVGEKDKDEVCVGDLLRERLGLDRLVGRHVAFLAEIEKIPVVAKCDVSVLVSGETGTGKELCARAIHYLSLRAGKPFVAVNCGAIPSELAENELFGHSKGAFTGAHSSEAGLIAEADGGTLFLDDVDCLSPQIQVKLLRFLQEKEYKPLGSARTMRADVRVLSSANVDLTRLVEEGEFRRDLYYRLNVVPLKLPPLRERLGDVPLLARHFLKKYSGDFGKNVKTFSPRVLQQMTRYEWPGNVRELENVVERAVVFAGGPAVDEIQIDSPSSGAALSVPDATVPLKTAKAQVVEEFEKRYLERLLRENEGNITRAARVAQKNRRAFFELMKKHHVGVPRISYEFRRDDLAVPEQSS
jgi:two-component system, NtrC family, response regulator GlrR